MKIMKLLRWLVGSYELTLEDAKAAKMKQLKSERSKYIGYLSRQYELARQDNNDEVMAEIRKLQARIRSMESHIDLEGITDPDQIMRSYPRFLVEPYVYKYATIKHGRPSLFKLFVDYTI